MYNSTFIGNIGLGAYLSKYPRNDPQTAENVSMALDLRNQSLSICMTEIMSIVQSRKEGGENDFQFFNISLLATIIPRVRACCKVFGRLEVCCEKPKIASSASSRRGML